MSNELGALRILYVEDDRDGQDLIRFVLESHGANVVAVGSAREAREELRTSDFDLLLCDLQMPEESGYDFVRSVRALPSEKASLPAIALSGLAYAEAPQEATVAGFQDYVPKPVRASELVEAIVENLPERLRRERAEAPTT